MTLDSACQTQSRLDPNITICYQQMKWSDRIPIVDNSSMKIWGGHNYSLHWPQCPTFAYRSIFLRVGPKVDHREGHLGTYEGLLLMSPSCHRHISTLYRAYVCPF